MIKTQEKTKKEFWNRDRYEKHYEISNPWKWVGKYREKVRNEILLDYFRFADFENALDIGCGEGNFTMELAAHVKHVDAFDISQNAIDRAKQFAQLPNIDYYQLDVKDFRYEGKKYDLIVCTEVMNLIEEPVLYKLMDEIRKSMNEKAVFVMETRVDGEYYSFVDVLSTLKKKFKVINVFSVHAPQKFFHQSLRKGFEWFRTPLVNKGYKIIVNNIEPKNAYQAAFICL